MSLYHAKIFNPLKVEEVNNKQSELFYLRVSFEIVSNFNKFGFGDLSKWYRINDLSWDLSEFTH